MKPKSGLLRSRIGGRPAKLHPLKPSLAITRSDDRRRATTNDNRIRFQSIDRSINPSINPKECYSTRFTQIFQRSLVSFSGTKLIYFLHVHTKQTSKCSRSSDNRIWLILTSKSLPNHRRDPRIASIQESSSSPRYVGEQARHAARGGTSRDSLAKTAPKSKS